jgi:uncharacterized protein YqfA (UPF0365 family)
MLMRGLLFGLTSPQLALVTVIVIGLMLGLILLVMILSFGGLWLRAYTSNADVSLIALVGMKLRKVNPAMIVDARVMAAQAGVGADPRTGITTKRLEAHFLAGGDVPRVIHAIIIAQRADLDLDFDRAAAIDLAGRDVLDAVRTSVYPKVIDCPNADKSETNTLSAVARNGVELKVRARVTVRTNLTQLIGGATEETIIARVGEGILTSIGSAADHLAVMENPECISKAVLARGLDAHTAFEIVSIDIVDIDLGENIGARLQVDQADADTRKAQALAETRRAAAIARGQEMLAKMAENRAALMLARAEIPKAMGEAFRRGNLESANHAIHPPMIELGELVVSNVPYAKSARCGHLDENP